jgi:aminoglycoside N3'-acetyltransferase
MIELLVSVFKAIPIIWTMIDRFAALWVQFRVWQMREENRDAIRKAIDTKDQRPIENAVGNPGAGKPSGIAGGELRDSLPGVRDPKGN